MKKTLILKLIESNNKPQVGDIIKSIIDKKLFIANNYFSRCEGDKVIKPIGISDEQYREGDKIYTEAFKSIYDVEIYPSALKDAKKIELLSNHFSPTIKQFIVDGLLKDGDEIEVEYDNTHTFPYPVELVLDTEGYAHISIPSKEICTHCNKEIYQEHTRYNGRYFHKETAMSNCLGTTVQAASKQEVKDNIYIPKVMYSEDEVRNLVIEAIQSFNDDVDEEVIISWFNQNKKK